MKPRPQKAAEVCCYFLQNTFGNKGGVVMKIVDILFRTLWICLRTIIADY